MLIVGILLAGLFSAPPASANCVGPSMSFSPQAVDRGAEVTATGQGWGDNCYDTGPPPEGEGVLGRPVSDIEIVLTKGEREWVLATVDADAEYGFQERVVIPPAATPGEALLNARKPGFITDPPNAEQELRISATPAIQSPKTTESPRNPAATIQSELPAEAGGSVAPWLTAATVAALLVVAVVTVARRKST